MSEIDLSEPLLEWYESHARQLPWRVQIDSADKRHPADKKNPYAIWISEVMLQQTRIEAVIPYYERWMQRFPTLMDLAKASQQDVLAAWEGLGYYGRARNLHKAAQMILANHAGELPNEVSALRKLPGVGPYTAAAIASIAFNLDEPALDGNVRRVLARVFNVTEPARSPQGERRLLELAAAHLPSDRAGEYNQALMDLGAIICTPRAPACERCPLASLCQARALGLQEARPVSLPRPVVPLYVVTAAVIERAGQVLIAQRPLDGLLGGLWEFPGGKQQPGEDLPACLRREICEELGVEIVVGDPFGVYRHAYTHFRVTLHAYRCRLSNGGQPQPVQVNDLRWVYPSELSGYPMGKIDRQIASRLTNSIEINIS